MRWPYIAATSAALWTALSLPASGTASRETIPCAATASVLRQLESEFSERLLGAGLSAGRLLRIYVSPSGSFSVILTSPDGVTCLLAAGRAWRTVPRPKGSGGA